MTTALPAVNPEATRAIRFGCEACGYVSDIPRGYGVEPDPPDDREAAAVRSLRWARHWRERDVALRDLVLRYRESANDALRLTFAAELETILNAGEPFRTEAIPV